MSMPYVGTAGYFVRQAAFISEYNRVAALYGSELTNGFNSIWQQFASTDQSAVQNLPAAVQSFAQSGAAYQQVLQQDGAAASILQVSDYYSVVPLTLQQSFVVLAAQMVIDGQTIQAATITSTTTPWANNLGDAEFVVSNTDQFGNPLNNTFDETLTVTCIQAATQFAETFRAVGEAQVSPGSPNWPGGSGANVQFAISNPAATGLLTDGSFSNWTGTGNNTPVNWTIVNGNAGVTVFRGTGGVRVGSTFDAVLTSDGSSATALAQNFNAQINTVYALSIQAKISSSDGSGTLVLELTDDDGTVLQDDAGNNLSKSWNMSAQVTTAFQMFKVAFATPRQLPSFVRFQVGFGVAPGSAKSLTLDLAGLVVATQSYSTGPWIAGFSGANASAVNDYYSVVVTNNLGPESFAMGLNRLYNIQQLSINLPASNSPTIPDSLITH